MMTIALVTWANDWHIHPPNNLDSPPPNEAAMSGKGRADDVPREAPKCANGVCTKQGLHLCARCKGVMYCSAACQKVHWKQGGHKQECKKPAAEARPAGVATVGTSAAVGGGGSCEGSCIICLDGDPRPIQSRCACRGDAGLAHVGCRAEDAAHRMKNRGDIEGWWKCGTCGQPFTGAMELGLARAWWSTAQRLPEEDDQRLIAAGNLASSLRAQGKYAEAEAIDREVLGVRQRVLGPEHPDTLLTAGNLASTLDAQGKYAEAETMHREVLLIKRRVLGPEHPHTLRTAGNLANTLNNQGKHTEAEAIQREVLTVQRRVLGPEHPHTLGTAGNLAATLDVQGKHAETKTLYREVLEVQRRVLGPEHPDTLETAGNLAISLDEQGKDTEAETMHREVLVVQRRVLGPEHPDTLTTAGNLANALRNQSKHTEAEKMFHDVLVVQRRVLGPEHPDTLWTTEKLEACVRFARVARGSAK
jgi:tetratricopeptide (TPR) repeat protein